jgi:anti-anti-sigma factor
MLHIEIENKNRVCIMRFSGRMVAGVDPEFLEGKANEVKQQDYSALVVDFGPLTALSSTGLGFLVGLYASAKNLAKPFFVAGLTERVREALEITRLNTVLPIVENVETALARLDQRLSQRA